MLKKILTIALLLCFSAASCTPTAPAAPAPTAAPQPSPTLERAPTRTPVTSSGSPAAPPAVGSRFVYAPGDGSVWLQDAATGKANVLVTPAPDKFADGPAFSPDGKHIAYTQTALSTQGAAQTYIRLIDVDGKNDRPFAIPDNNKTSFNWAAFSPDGKYIYYTSTFPVPPSSENSQIERLPVEGGDAQKVIQDARSAVLSPDGKRLAFIRFDFERFSTALWLADANGQNAKPLLADDVFSIIAAPHFSPDGKWILFVASGPPTRQLPGALLSPKPCEPALLCLFAQTAHANGLPWDLWLVSVEGDRFRQLTNIGADSPWPAWSRDGKQIAFFDTSGIYLLDVAPRVISKLSPNGGHGVFDWWMQP